MVVAILYGYCGPPHGQDAGPGELEGASLACGNDLGQGSTSPSTFAHALGVSGAPIGAVDGAADGRRDMGNASFGTAMSVPHGLNRMRISAAGALTITH